jgi:coenzyme Q-binding protein COQ10
VATTHTETKILPYTQQQLFDVVSAIDKYPEFLPWCVGARIIERSETHAIADLIIGYKFIREKFRSNVHFDAPHSIAVHYVSGPLKNLSNKWQFIDNGDATTTVNFFVSFEFSNPLLKQLVKIFFDEIIKRMVKAFEDRAAQVYNNI